MDRAEDGIETRETMTDMTATDGAGPRLSIIVPTLNEEGNIDPLITRVSECLGGTLRDVEILVADGGSTDDTRSRVEAWAARAPVRFVDARSGRGLSGDVLAAARQCAGDVVVVMDADLSHPPEKILELAAPVLAGEKDMVVGSRYVAGGETPDWPWSRRLMSRVAGLFAWPFVDVSDSTSGFFAVGREKLVNVDAQAEGFKIGLEVLLGHDAGLRVAEIPICFRDRTYGQSKMSLKQVGAYLRRLMALVSGVVSASNAGKFAIVGFVGLGVDLLIFSILRHFDFTLSTSHIASFLVATVSNYALNSVWVFRSTSGQRLRLGDYARFLTVALMALLLRGGVLAALTLRADVEEQIALVAAVVVAAVVNYLGAAFFVFPYRAGRVTRYRWVAAAIGLVAYTLLLRMVYLGIPDLIPEEAYYWNYAQHPSLGYLDHPPMVAWIIGLGTGVFGNTEFGVRIGPYLLWLVTAGFCFGYARNLFDKETALRSLLLVAVFPLFFAFGFFTTPDASLIAAWAGCLYFLERTLLAERRWAWLGVGVCLGLGMLSKYTIALLGPAVLAFVIVDARSRRWLLRPEPYLAVVVAAVLFSPVIAWNFQTDWSSFQFQTTRRMNLAWEFSLHRLIGDILLILTPVGAYYAYRLVRGSAAAGLRSLASPTRDSRRHLFVILFTLVPLSVFVAYSLKQVPNVNWTTPVWLAIIPGIARHFTADPATPAGRVEPFVRRLWSPVMLVLVISYGVILHYLSIGLPHVPYTLRPVAWKQLGRDVQKIEQEIEAQIGHAPTVVGMDKYNLASELAFYRGDHRGAGVDGAARTTSRHLFGGGALMYERWHPPEKQQGRTLLLVSFEPERLEDERIAELSERVDPIRERPITKLGVPAGHYFYRVAYGYHGKPGSPERTATAPPPP